MHGLGGSVAQFSPLLTSLVNVAPCLAIDLPGCGLSAFEPTDPAAYSIETLAALVAEAIEQHRDVENQQKVILVGHSLGCSMAVLLASSTSPLASSISKDVVGVVAICPRAGSFTDTQTKRLGLVHYIPTTVFDAFRLLDQRGGLDSASVIRFVGENADKETKRMQVQFNRQSKSAVFLSMAAGLKPRTTVDGTTSGMPGESVWSGIKVPLLCIAGELDVTCPPDNVEMIAKWLGSHTAIGINSTSGHGPLPVAAGDVSVTDTALGDGTKAHGHGPTSPGQMIPEMRAREDSLDLTKPPLFVLKTAVLPKPAAHGLLYATSTVRIVSGLIQSFVGTQIDHRLSLGWQLQHLTSGGKWDVKNLEKWKKVRPVSEPIAGVFRAMKTLREVDELHTPKVFVKNWAAKSGIKQGVRMVVDISHESPVYDPKGLEDGGVEYHKFPTVSKLPPTSDEVRAFVALIDNLREHLAKEHMDNEPLIAVHCHYGFNRTGFFVVSYLVERLGYQMRDALNLFADKRDPGIRHEHFIDELFVRYSPGLQRRPTIY